MDPLANPGDDFFRYANGGWLDRNPIPVAESAWGIGSVVREQLYVKLRKINEEAASIPGPAGEDRRKIGDFWTAAMDEAGAERLGFGPLSAELDRIDRIASGAEALGVAFALTPLGSMRSSPFGSGRTLGTAPGWRFISGRGVSACRTVISTSIRRAGLRASAANTSPTWRAP
jgi:predicted metalloendopeptidase